MSMVVLVPDGVGVRNFIFGRFLNLALEMGDVHVLHAIPDQIFQVWQLHAPSGVNWHRLVPYSREGLLRFMLRNSAAYAQMYWAGTRAARHNADRPIKGSWRFRTARHIARLVGRAAACRVGVRLLNHLHWQAAFGHKAVQEYIELFQRLKPQVLFCSHQRPASVLPVVLAARKLGIPTATFIFSWDNLTSKGSIIAPFDYFLVWSKLMREELLRYYPEIPPERVYVIGTPQFDPYADESLIWSREEFFKRVGGDPSRPIICYSGGDTGTCPEDPAHVRVLMELIRSGRIQGNPQVLLRPCPVDEGSRYNAVRRDYPELIYAPPAWVHDGASEWSQVTPLPEDVRLLANLTWHCDLNINMASTMTLDFAIHDKPVVNIAFDVADPPPFGVPLWDYFYKFDHYQPVIELGAARFARSPDELAEHVNAYLENPSLDREARRKLVELEVGVPIGSSSERIVQVLAGIAGTGKCTSASSAVNTQA
jgi:hypothetical protein